MLCPKSVVLVVLLVSVMLASQCLINTHKNLSLQAPAVTAARPADLVPVKQRSTRQISRATKSGAASASAGMKGIDNSTNVRPLPVQCNSLCKYAQGWAVVQVDAYLTVEDYVGGTPLVRLQRLPGQTSNIILAKLEGNNPAGSVKDRYFYC